VTRALALALVLAVGGCGLPAAYVPVLTAALGACAAACGPVVAFEKDAFDRATGASTGKAP